MTNSLSTSDRSAGPILAAHPQVRDIPINVFFFLKNIFVFPQGQRPLLAGRRVFGRSGSFFFL
jgi:hypothetical protein